MSILLELCREWATSLHVPNILQGCSGGVRVTLVPLFAHYLGATDGQLGFILGSAGISKVILDIPFGLATSLYGARIVMVFGMLLNGLGSVVATLSFSSFELGLASMLWGAGTGSFLVAQHLFIAKAVPRSVRGRLMSIIGGEVRCCSFIGPAIAGALMDVAGIRVAALSILPMSLGCAYMVGIDPKIREVDEEGREEEKNHDLFKEINDMWIALRKYGDVVVCVGVYAFSMISLRQTRSMLLAVAAMNLGLSGLMVGLVLGISFFVNASFFFLGGYIMDNFRPNCAAVPSTVGLGICFFLLLGSNGFVSLIIISILFGIADSTGCGVLMAITADHTPPSGGASFMGVMRAIQDLGQVIGPIACGLIMECFSFSSVCGVMGVVGILNGLWAYYLIPGKSISELEEQAAAAVEAEATGRAALAAAAESIVTVEVLEGDDDGSDVDAYGESGTSWMETAPLINDVQSEEEDAEKVRERREIK